MKRLLISMMMITAVLFTACDGGEKETEGEPAVTTENVEQTTTIQFEEEAFDFGTISQGEKVTHVFKFKNTGESDLVIVSAKGSCGCTVPEWPKEPIAPGAEGVINVVFNSEGKSGKQHKRVSVIANTSPATTSVALKGEVIAPEKPNASEASAEDATE